MRNMLIKLRSWIFKKSLKQVSKEQTKKKFQILMVWKLKILKDTMKVYFYHTLF